MLARPRLEDDCAWGRAAAAASSSSSSSGSMVPRRRRSPRFYSEHLFLSRPGLEYWIIMHIKGRIPYQHKSLKLPS